MVEITDCPYYDSDPADRCNLPSEVVTRTCSESTDGPVEIIAIRCMDGHFFTGPTEFLAGARERIQ